MCIGISIVNVAHTFMILYHLSIVNNIQLTNIIAINVRTFVYTFGRLLWEVTAFV